MLRLLSRAELAASAAAFAATLDAARIFNKLPDNAGRSLIRAGIQDYSWGTFTSTGQGSERTRREPCVFVKRLGRWVALGIGGAGDDAGAGALVMFFLDSPRVAITPDPPGENP